MNESYAPPTEGPAENDQVDREPTVDERRCSECETELVPDEEHGELVCPNCGLVDREGVVDRGAEWRAFSTEDAESKARVGPPRTELLHDRGLSSRIHWRDQDASGKVLDPEKREKMRRLRTWDERYRARDSKDRNLKQALSEINRMGSALGLPRTVLETAAAIYRRALRDDLLPGRSIEGVTGAAVYAAARQANVPRSIDEVTAVSRVGGTEIKRTYRYVVRELNLEIGPPDPESYVGRFATQIGLSDETKRRARGLLRTAKGREFSSGKSPVSLAAAALYAAALLTDEDVTQAAVSDATDVSTVTIRNRYRELLDAEGLSPSVARR